MVVGGANTDLCRMGSAEVQKDDKGDKKAGACAGCGACGGRKHAQNLRQNESGRNSNHKKG
jgi:MinD superfamily P-loop ATPase